jgi:hypothetical protein
VVVATIALPGASGATSATSAASGLPVGVFDLDEPSALAPPGPGALPGYTSTYVDDFTAPLDARLWGRFSGVPLGDPAGRFEESHVTVGKGELRIGTWRDPRRHERWVTGGVCLCGLPTTYGAYFVRSRETHPGPDDAELLWPDNNSWPPELDFDEMGTATWTSSWTDHFTAASDEVQGNVHLNVTNWHTWGVLWTPTSVTFVVDGRVWGEVTTPAEIPELAMTLDLQSQTWCGLQPECPTRGSSVLVDWVEVYSPTS